MDLIISNISFFLNEDNIKRIPKVGDLSELIKKADVCKLYIDTSCHACKESKDSSVELAEITIIDTHVLKLSEIKAMSDIGISIFEDFVIDIYHQNPNILDDDLVTLIFSLEN